MSQSILDMLSGQLGGQALEMIGSQLGACSTPTATATSRMTSPGSAARC